MFCCLFACSVALHVLLFFLKHVYYFIFSSHSEYELEGVKHMRMKFYVEGPFRKGTVHLEVKMVSFFKKNSN